MIAYERLCEALERHQRQLSGEEVAVSAPPPTPGFGYPDADLAPDEMAKNLAQTPAGFADGSFADDVDGAPLDDISELAPADVTVDQDGPAYADPAAYEAQQAAYAEQQAAYEAQQQAAYAQQQAAYEAQQAAYAQQGGLAAGGLAMQPTAADLAVDGTPLDESGVVTTTPVEKPRGEGQG